MLPRNKRLTVWEVELFASIHGERLATPNDPKLSDRGVRRGTCMVGGKAAAEAGAVTHGAVRCSAWLGVAADSSRCRVESFVNLELTIVADDDVLVASLYEVILFPLYNGLETVERSVMVDSGFLSADDALLLDDLCGEDLLKPLAVFRDNCFCCFGF